MSYADVAAKGPAQSDAEVRYPLPFPIDNAPRALTIHTEVRTLPLRRPRIPPPTNPPSTRRVPNAVPEILHDDSGVHSLDSLSSSNAHIQSLQSSMASSSFADQQASEERAESARIEGRAEADEAAREARQFVQHVEEEAGLLGGTESTSSSSNKKTTTTSSSSFSTTTGSSSSGNSARYEQVKEKLSGEYREVKKEAGKEAEKAKKEVQKAEKWAEKNKGNPVVVGNAVVIAGLAGVLGFGAYRLSQNESLTWRVVGVWAGAVGLFAVGDYFVSSWLFKKYPPKN